MSNQIENLKRSIVNLKMSNNKKFSKFKWEQIKALETRLETMERDDKEVA